MTPNDYDIAAERIIGKVARHARHTNVCSVLQSAKSIAYIVAEELHEQGSEAYKMLCDAIARVCPEKTILEQSTFNKKTCIRK